MENAAELFGKTPDGQDVHRVKISGGGLTAHVLTWGAVIQDLRLEGHTPPLVLGFENLDDYPAHSPYFGAIAGRVANRIAHGRYTVDGKTFTLDRNMDGVHTLHGGALGIGKRVWTIADLGTSHVTLTLRDPDGMMGFGGDCDITCDYVLKEGGVLHVALTSTVSQRGPVNLTHHSYFTLDDRPSCMETHLRMVADRITAVDDTMIPTGETPTVENTAFDFRKTRPMADPLPSCGFFDHNFCLRSERGNLQEAAVATSPHSKLEMRVFTTEPGLQFYAGHKIATPSGLTGQPYGPHAGFCLEAQNWPNAINEETFPDSIIEPDTALRQVTEYRFRKL